MVLLVALADTLFNYYNLTEQGYQTGSWFDWGWSFGWLFVGYASLSALWWPQTDKAVATTITSQNLPSGSSILRSLTFLGLVRVIAPYFFAAMAIGFVALHDYNQPKNGSPLHQQFGVRLRVVADFFGCAPPSFHPDRKPISRRSIA